MIPLPPEIVIPTPITSTFIRSHQQYVFIYGGAVRCDSTLGQASVCQQNDNTYDIPTRWSMCKSNGYFNDGQIFEIKWAIDMSISTIKRLHKDKPVILFPKIGLGDSRMREFAPKAYAYMMAQLEQIVYRNVKYVTENTQIRSSSNVDTNLI